MANEVLRYEHIDELDTYFADLKKYKRRTNNVLLFEFLIIVSILYLHKVDTTLLYMY